MTPSQKEELRQKKRAQYSKNRQVVRQYQREWHASRMQDPAYRARHNQKSVRWRASQKSVPENRARLLEKKRQEQIKIRQQKAEAELLALLQKLTQKEDEPDEQ